MDWLPARLLAGRDRPRMVENEAIKARFDPMQTTTGPDTKVVVAELVVQ